MKYQFIFYFISLFFTLNAYSISDCYCSYSQSAGHTGYTSAGDTVTFNHSWGNGGTCTATCSQSCVWTNKSSGCNGFVLSDNSKKAKSMSK